MNPRVPTITAHPVDPDHQPGDTGAWWIIATRRDRYDDLGLGTHERVSTAPDRAEADRLASSIRGALADAYHAGRADATAEHERADAERMENAPILWQVTIEYRDPEWEPNPNAGAWQSDLCQTSRIIRAPFIDAATVTSSRATVPDELYRWTVDVLAPSSCPQGVHPERITFAHHEPGTIGAEGASSFVVHDTTDPQHWNDC